MTRSLSRKTVLVTGAGSGFGRLTVEILARRGYSVFAGVREIAGRNAAVAEELRAWGGQAGLALGVVELDVADEASVARAVQSVIGEEGYIDVLINNAGLLSFGIAESFSPGQLREMFEVNVIGPHRIARAVLPSMRRRGGGLIVQVSSVLARYTLPCFGVYCASKSALEALTECIRDELAGTGVDVVIVEPGAYPTGLADKIIGPADRERSDAYPAADKMSQQLTERFSALTAGSDAPDPREVATAIADLIELSPERRPLRTVLGRAVQETRRFNETAETFRQLAHDEIGFRT